MVDGKQNFITCAGCSCLCDDIPFAAAESNDLLPDCPIAHEWFGQESVDGQCYVDGRSVSFDDAVDRAAGILNASQAPFVSGLDGIATQAQFETWNIAEQLEATIDTSFHNRGRAGTLTLQRHGKTTATLGEVSTRSELVIFWFCEPMKTHPRLIERFCKSAKRIVLIGTGGNTTANVADEYIEITKENANAVVSVLRALTGNARLDELTVESATGHPLEVWKKLATSMAGSHYGALFYGHGGDSSDEDPNSSELDAALDGIYQLAIELNRTNRFVTIGLRRDGNALSGENVLTASCGFPFAVRTNPHPQFNGLQYSSQNVLADGDCDAALICSTHSIEPNQISDKLKIIVLTDRPDKWTASAAVVFPTGLAGLDQRGDWIRMDGVLLALQSTHGVNGLDSEAILNAIAKRIKTLRSKEPLMNVEGR